MYLILHIRQVTAGSLRCSVIKIMQVLLMTSLEFFPSSSLINTGGAHRCLPKFKLN